MLDHIGFPVSDLKRSMAFYESALAPLGIKLVMVATADMPGSEPGADFGADEDRLYLWLGIGQALKGYLHVAFTAKDRASVDAFYAAAIKAGGKDNGPPGLRPQYHKDYYGAFVLDPDGHNIEAVCHKPA
jgi:catechol 2,3-dioxygenase-like lactoylglutathione lyase family enzyme